jgi:NitT/TauT family transport system permease protein
MTMSAPRSSVRPGLFAARVQHSARATNTATLLAFAIPFLLWCVISYVPFIWHPLVHIHDPGDSQFPGTYAYLEKDQLVESEVFAARNQELAAAGKQLAVGEPANPIYLPAPHQVARALYTAFTTPPERAGDFWLHESLLQSVNVIFWGFFWSALIGLPLGIVCGTFGILSRLTEPFIDFVRYMPAPVFGALAVSILGLGDEPKIAIIFVGTFFQMVLVVANTTRGVDIALLQAAQTLGANNRQLVFKVVIPGALPALYRDMRILIGWAWTYLVVAELIGEKSGLSAFIYQQQRYRHFDNVYAAIVIIGVAGLCVDQALAYFAKFIFPWESGNLTLRRIARSIQRSLPTRFSSAPVPAEDIADAPVGVSAAGKGSPVVK